MGKLKEDKRYINKVCLYQNSLGFKSPSLVMRIFFFFSWYRKDFFHMGVFSLAFRKKREGQHVILKPALSQVPLVQNNPYAKPAYFRVTYSGFLPLQSGVWAGDFSLAPLSLIWQTGFPFQSKSRIQVLLQVAIFQGPQEQVLLVCVCVCVATSLMEGENGWILKLSTDMNCFKLTLPKAFVPMVLCLIDWSLMPIVRASWF